MHQKERPSRPAGEATPSPARGPEAGGRRVVAGRYELHEVLGEGGFAVSHRALDRRTGQACVVKEVLYRKIEDPKVLDLLEREARVLAHLSHPRIPRFVEYFAERLDGETRLYLVQEYVAGRSLAQWARDGRHFDEREVIRIGLQVGRILEHLHGLRPPIIHRDVKPGNVVLGADGEAWLVDFGAVRDRILHEIRTEGEAATIVGTYGYMPFEQFQGRALPASDIYALGMTLVFLLSHKEPHEIEAVSGRFELEPHARASPGLLRVVRRMIEPKPEDRHASATELCAELEALLGPPERRAPRPRRQWLAGAGLAAAALGMVVWSLVPSKPRSAPTQPSAQPRPREVISAVPARRPHVQVLYGLSIKGRLTHDGQPLEALTDDPPDFWMRNEDSGRVQPATVTYDRGHFVATGLPAGRIGVQVSVNLNRGNPGGFAGDLYGWQTFEAGPKAETVEMDLYKVLRLREPQDTNARLAGWGEDCPGMFVTPSPVRLDWDAPARGLRYEYTIERIECPYLRPERVLEGTTTDTHVTLPLPPSGANEFYLLRLDAKRGNRRVASIMTTGPRGGMGWDYRFRAR